MISVICFLSGDAAQEHQLLLSGIVNVRAISMKFSPSHHKDTDAPNGFFDLMRKARRQTMGTSN